MDSFMKRIIGATITALAFVAAPARAQEAEMIASAQAASQAWLTLTDSGAYSASWEIAAGLFQEAVPKSGWASQIQSVRSPLGAVKSRVIKSAKFARVLPGAPTGEYVVIQYETQFEQMDNAVETVTPLREKDGSWKVSGYYIK
jgi:Protein of unknown function (DUF4019)